MHIPRIEFRSLDETVEAADLGQTPADVVFLSFSDSDLNALGRAYDAEPGPKPTLRLASLAALRHPYSVDLYLERVCARAKIVVARVLGGADYWRYGVDELAALARRRGIKLALLPGDRRADQRLEGGLDARPRRHRNPLALFRRGRPAQHGRLSRLSRRRLRRRESSAAAREGQRLRQFEAACSRPRPTRRMR